MGITVILYYICPLLIYYALNYHEKQSVPVIIGLYWDMPMGEG